MNELINLLECDFAKADEWQYCTGLSDSKCSSEDSTICDSRCKWIKCTYKNRKKNEVQNSISSCVPLNTMRDQEVCEDFIESFIFEFDKINLNKKN